MAAPATYRPSALLLALLFVGLCCSSTVVVGFGRKVGGRTEIEDVKDNEEVQELGRFSVEEFNRSQREEERSRGNVYLVFSEVVRAERQVVSGIKYYLNVEALEEGEAKKFDAVVVVKPWLESKQLLTFIPCTN
ncbi:PREDICTED: cysteine proteinase inhibitor 4-like [Nelumbo nucifera]|uniref:Cystatin domain-containing protein n=2 Tax=Nelumbo nucifera TaxID=4432 RepID=A0A822Z2D3_NELNU|nr:PREDICTED: cysteine proteinase inhibitor 4-like [Nelumbo nucifera]DAD37146.1 TPA_asm: hypothetical protein HUJ06_007787 [Nelumbo nucifera]